MRDAARRCALGIHLDGGSGRDLQTPPGVTGRSDPSPSPQIRHIEAVKVEVEVRACRVEKLPNAVKKSPACVFIAFHPRGEENEPLWWEKINSERRVFVRVGRVLVRDSSGPLYGQG